MPCYDHNTTTILYKKIGMLQRHPILVTDGESLLRAPVPAGETEQSSVKPRPLPQNEWNVFTDKSERIAQWSGSFNTSVQSRVRTPAEAKPLFAI